MVAQIEARGITDPLVLEAMREVPRERFVPAALLAADGTLGWPEHALAFVPLIGAEGWTEEGQG